MIEIDERGPLLAYKDLLKGCDSWYGRKVDNKLSTNKLKSRKTEEGLDKTEGIKDKPLLKTLTCDGEREIEGEMIITLFTPTILEGHTAWTV